MLYMRSMHALTYSHPYSTVRGIHFCCILRSSFASQWHNSPTHLHHSMFQELDLKRYKNNTTLLWFLLLNEDESNENTFI